MTKEKEKYEPIYEQLKTAFEQAIQALEKVNPAEEEKTSVLNTVNYLRNGNTLEDLKASCAIKFTRHQEFPSLVSLNYTEGETLATSNIGNECCGLVLDEEDNWNVVAFPFHRTFEHNEKALIPKLDWNTVTVFEQIDGPLAILYHYRDCWRVASRNTPDGSDVLAEGQVILRYGNITVE